ncbi:YeeE/YedE thiosulfate transporter family protein [Candidatus Mycobacterium methanotrophicum]|uniref:YeeE/YedE family protein n=1 Tax=Candidatus Mycobacterium methanotrophicum TaxID=2943498 RepID=A0ABY4QJB8_9MYCO|nr:YeeE/YedE thiosulfate transporter family protein [Candidatus Mycobacterium methanotrophicum]UQX10934.1 YeeE/YedE family protein [Candidatus Mycobacterium methanotrophicum]
MTAPLWVGLFFGVLFGGVGEIWGLGNPETLIRLARWKDRLLVGCLAVASAVGAVILYGLYALGVSMHFSPKPVYVVGVTLGGVLFGAGMAVSGYVPGSELMALGEGRRDALYALPGGLLGAAAWTVLYQSAPGHWLVHTANYGDLVASGSIQHIRPMFTVLIAVIYAIALLLATAVLPRYQGGKSSLAQAVSGLVDARDREATSDTAAYLAEGALPPCRPSRLRRSIIGDIPNSNFYSPAKLITSAVIGAAVALAILLHQIFGESTTYSWLVGRLFLPHFDDTQKVMRSIGWEPLSDLGTFLGALLAAVVVSRHYQGLQPVIPPSWRNRFGDGATKRAVGSFGGFFTMMFGARMADGCTSGHLLSGGVQMAASAWLFAVAVFAGMVTTSRVFYGNCPPTASRVNRGRPSRHSRAQDNGG